MTCFLDRAHEKPIPVADNVLSVSEMNVYIAGIFRYNYCEDNGLDIIDSSFSEKQWSSQ